MLFLPCGGPKRAALGEVITLTQLFLTNIAAHQRAAVLINSVSEVLAGHAKTCTLPTLQVVILHKAPLLHTNQRKYTCTTPRSALLATHANPSSP